MSKYAPIIYFDLETTGLNYYHNRIIEVCGQKEYLDGQKEHLDGQNLTETPPIYRSLCNLNGTMLPYRITQITKIRPDMLRYSPPEGKVLQEFIDFGGRTRQPLYLVAHNCDGFDKWFLQSRCSNYGIRIPPNWRYLDTIQMAKLLLPGLKSYSLASLCKLYKIEQRDAHRAEDDVRCLRELFHRLVDEYQTQHEDAPPKFSTELAEDLWKKTQFQ